VKPIKMFGLAALAALMAMAFVGASSALATGSTALCEQEESICAEPITHLHEATLPGHKATILYGSGFNVECDALFLGDALNGGLGNPLIVHGNFTFTNCEGGCTVTEENGPIELRLLKEASELAKVTSGTGGGAGLIHVVCGGFLNCRYTGSGLVWHGLGSLTSSETNGEITISGQEPSKESGIFCPSSPALDATLTPLEPIYVSS
jgi:hypothetical protein